MIYYQNVRGLRTKYNELRLSANESGFEMLALTETRLNESIPSNMVLDSDSYNIYRCDRSRVNNERSRGGGVLLAYSSRYPSVALNMNQPTLEALCIRVSFPKFRLFVGIVYVPPYLSSDRNYFESLSAFISDA